MQQLKSPYKFYIYMVFYQHQSPATNGFQGRQLRRIQNRQQKSDIKLKFKKREKRHKKKSHVILPLVLKYTAFACFYC